MSDQDGRRTFASVLEQTTQLIGFGSVKRAESVSMFTCRAQSGCMQENRLAHIGG